MRILLNLLPVDKKAKQLSRFRFRFFLWQSCLVLFLEVYYIAILGGIFTLLRYQAQVGTGELVASDQFNTEAKKLVGYQEKFKETNLLANTLIHYEEAHLYWSELFTQLQKISPPGVTIIELLTKDYTVSIRGQAKTREQFLQFESALKKAECISDVRVPISNLFIQKEVDFQIDFNIKRECLLGP